MIIDTHIIPGVSIGGIRIGECVDTYISILSENYSVVDDEKISWIIVDDGLISMAYDSNRIIETVCANSRFEGDYAGLIWPGMTALQVMRNTYSQSACAGILIVNKISGLGMPLPASHDDFEKFSESVPDGIVLENICVFRDSRKKKK